MDHFFEEEVSRGLFWLAPLPDYQSAFVPYSAAGPAHSNCPAHSGNVNKRMIEFLRRGPSGKGGRGRCFRHMINERLRRERHKQSFTSLHAMLPHGTKNDKNSIMQMAAREIVVMMRSKEELRRRNMEMEATLGHKMTFNSSNGIDSLLEVLNCLRSMGSDILSIQSCFSDQQLAAELVYQNKMAGGGDVENAVWKRLDEVEKKIQGDCKEGSIS